MKKGITMVSLAVVVLLLAVFTSLVLYTNSDVLKVTNKTKFAIEILDIQTKTDNYYIENGVYPVGEEIEFDISKLKEEEREQIKGEKIVDEKIKVYILNINELGIKNLLCGNNKSENDVYAVSKITGKIYYLKGVAYNNITYYSAAKELYADLYDKLGVQNYKEIRKSDVTFKINSITLGKDPVLVEVFVPSEATDVTVTATNDVNVGGPITEGANRRYSVNTNNVITNYDIKVKYTLNGEAKEVSHSIKNVDVTGPVITVKTVANAVTTTIEVTVKDNESAVEKIKYDKGALTKSYFEKYGKIVENNTITCTETGIYTIYAVDSMGNATIYAQEFTVN